MSAPPLDLDALRASVTKQAGAVRQLKADGAPAAEVQAAVAALHELRKALDEASAAAGGVDPNKWPVNKKALEDTIARRMFVVPSFEIHGGVAGLFDYGPPGCALKENLLALWRQHFVLEDSMLQIECTTLTSHPVLKASGHVDKFEDLMVKDVKSGECYRADKLLEDFIENLCMVRDAARGPSSPPPPLCARPAPRCTQPLSTPTHQPPFSPPPRRTRRCPTRGARSCARSPRRRTRTSPRSWTRSSCSWASRRPPRATSSRPPSPSTSCSAPPLGPRARYPASCAPRPRRACL